MKSIQVVFVSLIVCLVTACSMQTAPQPEWTGQQAPATRLFMLNGDQVLLESLQGHQTIVLFWAQWCRRSQRIIRQLNGLVDTLRTQGRDINMVAVSVDKAEDLSKVQETIHEAGLTNMDHAFSGNEAADEAYMAFGAQSLPMVYVVNSSGMVVAQSDDFDVIRQAFGIAK